MPKHTFQFECLFSQTPMHKHAFRVFIFTHTDAQAYISILVFIFTHASAHKRMHTHPLSLSSCEWLTSLVNCVFHFMRIALTLNVLYHTIPHELCVGVRWKMCTAYRASFRHILKKVTVCFLSTVYNNKMLLTSTFSKENSTFSLDECVLLFKVFTTAARKLRVKMDN